MENKFPMHKLQIYVSESIMNSNDNGFLFHPHQMFVFSSGFDIYLPSSETEKYRMTNGSCPLFCLFAEIL